MCIRDRYTGYITLLMVVAFQNVSPDYIEAASIDGAGPVRRAISVVLPLAKEQLLVCSIITVIGAFKPVSYTHLDVYKRQELSFMQDRWNTL